MRNCIVLVAGIFISSGWSTAQVRGGDLAECQNETSESARLACYDRKAAESQVERGAADTPQEMTKNPVQPAASTPTSAEPASDAARVDEFGTSARVRQENESGDDELDEIRAVIVDIDTRRYGNRVITLDNGQVWVEESAKKSVRLEPGDEVRIKAGVLGSFKLFGANNRSTRVDRIK
jgi:hypothetical protein